jgi:hypothetical protein
MILRQLFKFTIAIALLGAVSCKKSDDPVSNSNEIKGCWTNPVATDSIWTYNRASALDEDDYGFSFLDNQLFIERKNAGWCGTPPITYANFEGSWNQTDSMIFITVDYWGGQADYLWEIIDVDANKLVIIKKDAVYR